MAASGMLMSKQTLQNTTMYVHRIREVKTTKIMRIEVTFPYERLAFNKSYETAVGPWDLQAVKGRQNTTLQLFTRAALAQTSRDVVCCIKYDDAVFSDWVDGEEVSWDTYVITLSTKMISNNRQNAFLEKGIGLVCVLEVSISMDSTLSPHAGTRQFQKTGQLPPLIFSDPRPVDRLETEESDQGRLMDILVAKSARSLFTDFKLISREGLVVPAHKSVLAVRSDFFRAAFSLSEESGTCEQAELSFPENVVQSAIFFMYYSEVYVTNMDLVQLLFNLSETLQIGRLNKVCLDYIIRTAGQRQRQ